MVKKDLNDSDLDSDSSSIDSNWNERNNREPGIIQIQWDAIEETLYQEENSKTALKAHLLHECRLWKESFPYLRVRGQHIENPLAQKKELIRQQIISLVVEQVVSKLEDGFHITETNNTAKHQNSEPYFERRKKKTDKPVVNEQSSIISSNENISITQDMTKSPPRGILKNSPSRLKATQKAPDRSSKTRKESTSNKSLRSSSLPRISSRNNNWLIRSEKHIQNHLTNRRTVRRYPDPPRKEKPPCTCAMHDTQHILPPIKTPDFKRI